MRAMRVRGLKGFIGLAAGVAGGVAGDPRGAAAQRPSVAVLGVASEEGDDDLAAALTSALRAELENDEAVKLSNSRASLSQMTMLQDCDIVEADCRMKVGKAANADQVLYGGLRRAGTRGHEVEVHLFMTQDGKDAMARRALPSGESSEAHLSGHARALLAALRGEAPAAQPPVAAPTDEGPPPVATVTPDVEPLEEAQADTAEPPPSQARSSNDWLGYTLLGVAAVSAGLTVFSWTQIKAAETDEHFVAYGNAVYVNDPSVKDVCEKASGNMPTRYGVDDQTLLGARSACDQGETFDLLQYVFLGATLVSAGLGTYFLLDDEGEGGAASSGELSLRARVGRSSGLLSVRLDL
jgi:hypothetical protein